MPERLLEVYVYSCLCPGCCVGIGGWGELLKALDSCL